MEQETFQAGQILKGKNKTMRGLCVVQTGHLDLKSESNAQPYEKKLKPGDHFGELGVLTNHVDSFMTVSALEVSTVLLLNPSKFEDLCQRLPWLAHRISHAILQRHAPLLQRLGSVAQRILTS